MVLLLAGIVVAVAVLWAICVKKRRPGHVQGLQLPPGPRPLPIVGNLLHFSKDKQLPEQFRELAAKYGPIMYIWIASKPGLLISSAEMARIVLKEKDEIFADRPPRTYSFRELVDPLHDITFSPYGPEWRVLRKLLSDTVLSQKRQPHFQQVREEELSAVVRSIRQVSVRGKTESERAVDLQLQCKAVNLNNSTRMLMGKRYFILPGESGDDSTSMEPPTEGLAMEKVLITDVVAALVGEVMVSDFIPWLGFLDRFLVDVKDRVKGIKARAEEVCKAALEERRLFLQEHSHHQPESVLDIFLAAQNELGAEEVPDARIKAFLKGLVLAMDSNDTVLGWIMAELLRHPDQMRKLQEELDRVVGKERKVVESDIPNLPFLRALVKESLRLHPVGGMPAPHYCKKDTEVAGFLVPAGTTVYINFLAIFRDPAVWEQPDSFLPERFLQNPEVDVRGTPTDLMPFGAGRRMCPGFNLALGLVHFVVARFAHSFDWEPTAEFQHRDVETYPRSATGKLVTPLLAVASPRLPSHCY